MTINYDIENHAGLHFFNTELDFSNYSIVVSLGITKILRSICLFSENKIKSAESISKQPTQLNVQLNSSLRHIIVTLIWFLLSYLITTLPYKLMLPCMIGNIVPET